MRKLLAVGDQLAPIPEEIMSEHGGIISSLVRRPAVGLARVSIQKKKSKRGQNIIVAKGDSGCTVYSMAFGESGLRK